MNTPDSAWTVVDTLLGIGPMDLKILRKDLDRIQSIIQKNRPKRWAPIRALVALFKSKVCNSYFLSRIYVILHLSSMRRNNNPVILS